MHQKTKMKQLYTPKDKLFKMPKYTRLNQQGCRGSFPETWSSFSLQYLPTRVEFPCPAGVPSGQLQCCGAERLTQLNFKTTGNRMIRGSSIILMGLNFQKKTAWLCWNMDRARWVCLTPDAAAWVGLSPGASFTLPLCCCPPSSFFNWETFQMQPATGSHRKDFFIYVSLEASKKYLTPLWQISQSLTALLWLTSLWQTEQGKGLERKKKERTDGKFQPQPLDGAERRNMEIRFLSQHGFSFWKVGWLSFAF